LEQSVSFPIFFSYFVGLSYNLNRKFPDGKIQLSTLSPQNIISNYICGIASDQIQLRLFAVDEVSATKR
jgi:hypothetical protein